MKRLMFVLFLMLPAMVSAHEPERTEAEVKDLALKAILENPEIIMQAVAILEQRDRDKQAQGALQAVAQLEASPDNPVFGNPDGDVTVVEFFDYNCGYCRRAGPVLQEILGEDANVKVIMREWPILGEASVYASRAALAARMQGQYEAFHWGLMNGGGRANEATVRALAGTLGLDIDKLMADMNGPEVNAHLAESDQLARTLGFTGTPAFIVGGQVSPGFLEKDQMNQMIAQARENKG